METTDAKADRGKREEVVVGDPSDSMWLTSLINTALTGIVVAMQTPCQGNCHRRRPMICEHRPSHSCRTERRTEADRREG